MEIIIFSITAALYLWAGVMCFARQTHMFQLNSYSAKSHVKWCVKNPYSTVSNVFSLAFCAIAILSDAVIQPPQKVSAVLHIAFAAAFLLFALSNLHRGTDKTPLVYTARVKRLLFTYELISAALCALSFALYFNAELSRYSYAVLFAAYALLVPFLLLSNLINAPAEKAVKRYYLNDALKILKSCPELTVVGITGSFGKTSMKHFLSTILSQKYNVLVPPKNYNTPVSYTHLRAHET